MFVHFSEWGSTMAQMVHFFTSIRILNSEFRIPNSEFRIPNSEFRIPHFEKKMLCIEILFLHMHMHEIIQVIVE